MNEEALKVHGTSLRLSNHRMVFQSVALLFFYQTRQAIYWKYFIEPEYITSAIAWNQISYCLVLQRTTSQVSCLKTNWNKRRSVFALRNCMGWDHQVSESALAPSRVSISISTSGSTSTSISKSAVHASANQRWPNWPARHPRVIQVDW